jgi:hypothetical protein
MVPFGEPNPPKLIAVSEKKGKQEIHSQVPSLGHGLSSTTQQ